MIKKLRPFFFFSCLIFAVHDSLAVEYQNKYRRKNFYKVEDRECVCSCHDFKGFSGLQFFGSSSLILNHKNCEVSAARFLHPNIYSLFQAYRENKQQASKDLPDKSFPDFYKECFSVLPSLSKNFGGSLGVRYMWGGHKHGYAVCVNVGKRMLFDLLLKSGAGENMEECFRSSGLSNDKVKTVKQVRDELEQRENSLDDAFYKIPENINYSAWNVDVLFERNRCFVGDMLKTQELNRATFCLIGFCGLGVRINFLDKISDSVFSKTPKENADFVKKHRLPICPLFKLGLQGLFKSGFFAEIDVITQLLYRPGIVPIPLPCPTLGLGKLDSSILGELKKNWWFLLNIHPEVKVSLGYDFYGLCVGKKLEEYYDN